jgi:hypothetical protein
VAKTFDVDRENRLVRLWIAFLHANGRPLLGAEPDVDVPLVERVACGETGHAEIIKWLAERTAPPS